MQGKPVTLALSVGGNDPLYSSAKQIRDKQRERPPSGLENTSGRATCWGWRFPNRLSGSTPRSSGNGPPASALEVERQDVRERDARVPRRPAEGGRAADESRVSREDPDAAQGAQETRARASPRRPRREPRTWPRGGPRSPSWRAPRAAPGARRRRARADPRAGLLAAFQVGALIRAMRLRRLQSD